MAKDVVFEGIDGIRVLVTGASSGIGNSIARLFGVAGAKVGVHYCNSRKGAEAVTEEIIGAGGQARMFQADLLKLASGVDMVRAFIKSFGGIDVLVNNAGAIYGTGDFLSVREQEWDETFNLNVKAPFVLIREAFSVMSQQGSGRIINISSISAKYGGSPSTLHYGAAKAALEALSLGLAKSGAKHNILVNCVRAGFVETEFHSKIGRSKNDIEKRIELMPLKKVVQPLDVARMVLFLASEAGDCITGEIFTVASGD